LGHPATKRTKNKKMTRRTIKHHTKGKQYPEKQETRNKK
jgi:hypothetical protein